MTTPGRRPLAARDAAFFQSLAKRLGNAGVRPNTVSIASVLFIAAGTGLLLFGSRQSSHVAAIALFAFPVFILLRSICNLIDGMIAIEGDQRSAAGEVFNDFPDRVADPLMCLAVGYAAIESQWAVPLGWCAALLSVLVAYVRMLGGATGAGQTFAGPMAKTHRMVVVSIACIAAGIERLLTDSTLALSLGLGIVVAGCAITIVRRLRWIVRTLESQ